MAGQAAVARRRRRSLLAAATCSWGVVLDSTKRVTGTEVGVTRQAAVGERRATTLTTVVLRPGDRSLMRPVCPASPTSVGRGRRIRPAPAPASMTQHRSYRQLDGRAQ